MAYVLAVHNLELDRAQRYAEQAVAAATENLRNLNLDRLEPAKFTEVAALMAYWDTLGWIYFRTGDPERAESYIHAAWLLTQRGEVGDHLGQIYEQQEKRTWLCASMHRPRWPPNRCPKRASDCLHWWAPTERWRN